ncbi:MAG: hypothetical protein M3Y07_03785 [Acidobacteriota bacterium]|nr:hypothetical protein [Acidobacteriota bacterium]
MVVRAQDPTIVNPQIERDQVREFERVLNLGVPLLVGASGERIELPNTVYEVLRKIVDLMAHCQAVTLVPDDQIVTNQRTAGILDRITRDVFDAGL